MEPRKQLVVIVGTGFVADFYMRSQELHSDVEILGAFDLRADRLAEFCAHWKVAAFDSLQALLAKLPDDGLVLNLTSPASHYTVTRQCLEAGKHVYSEKPLATELGQAQELVELARERGLQLAGAPCSYLSEAAMALAGRRQGRRLRPRAADLCRDGRRVHPPGAF